MPIIIQTVLGPIEPSALGCTLTHEHLSLDFSSFYSCPPSKFKDYLKDEISLQNIGFIRQYPYSSKDNLILNDERAMKAVKKDVKLFKRLCGDAIVENTSHGLGRNLEFLCQVSKSYDVHVVAGTGHYVQGSQQPEHANMTIEEMSNLYIQELTEGVDVPEFGKVKCGFIGEVGSEFPIHDFEKQAIKATGEVQELLGCGVSFHPGCVEEAPFEVARLYLEAGGRANKCVMSHLDRTIFNFEKLMEFAELGTYLQYDFFGSEVSFNQFNKSIDMPTDSQRINDLVKLVKEGYTNRILMSHDIHTKHRLTCFGGHGLHHIPMCVIPRLCCKGLEEDDIDKIVITNPAAWLKFYGCGK